MAYWMDISLKSTQSTTWEEAQELISLLRAWGITYLVGENNGSIKDTEEQLSSSSTSLIARLARCSYPRIRDASIALFLLHPELAPSVLEAIAISEGVVAEQITTLVLAALYLQRLWSIRLTLAFGSIPSFPEHAFASLWHSRQLPAPICYDGKLGLEVLQQAEQKRTGLPFNYRADWQNQIDHLLQQEEARQHPLAVTPFAVLENKEHDQECDDMSMRPNVDKGQIETFLKNLGRAFRKSGRLYLVGGAALVHMGVRAGFTQDIDVEVRATHEDEMLEAIRKMKDTMQINIEFASPADFIPIPKQWEANVRYIGRYGMIDAFYFDFYSIALSKIQRGSTRDINDVRLLLQQNIITLAELDTVYNEVLPQVGKRPYNRLDPKQFALHYTTIRQLLENEGQ